MNLLLDTHVFIWMLDGDKRMSQYARELIEDQDNNLYMSVASVWEMTIKSGMGRLNVPTPPTTLIKDHIYANDIQLLPITPAHFDVLHTLPYHHKDPFDRLIIAQAIHEKMNLVTKDALFAPYTVQIVWNPTNTPKF